MRCYGEKPASFTRLQPSGNIPVAIIDGTIYNQSNDIMYALEEMFPENKKLLPPIDDQNLRMKAQSLLRLERTLFSAWMYWLTGNERSKDNFIRVLREVESELANSVGGDFFLGKEISLVDLMFAPFLERICASLIFFKGYQIRVAPGDQTEFTAINRWFDAMETLESYKLTKSDYYTHCWDLPPQLGGCTYATEEGAYEKAINGERRLDGTGGSWELPLQPHNGGVEPDWNWCGDEAASKREAIERLSFNHASIVSFAARGAGKKGMPAYMAALSDPNAKPSEGVKGSVDAAIRAVCIALIEDDEDKSDAVMKEIVGILQNGGESHIQDVIASLAYLRDRVGVPRDMRLPAARQLRARLNWAIEKMI
jgi:glutathione S-transferase